MEEKIEKVLELLKEATNGEVKIESANFDDGPAIFEFSFNGFMSNVHIAVDQYFCEAYKPEIIASEVMDEAYVFVKRQMFKAEA